jgi:hypothetical protein
MKNNKYQITGIKGRLLHLIFVTCYLLIVLLYACDDGYQASVKSIKFYYQEQAVDDDEPVFNDDGDPVLVNVEVDNAHPFKINSASSSTTDPTILFVKCEIPSSIKEISIEVNYDPSELVVVSNFADPANEDHVVDPTTGIIKVKNVDAGASLQLTVNAASDTLTTPTIKVNVEPGGITATCSDISL